MCVPVVRPAAYLLRALLQMTLCHSVAFCHSLVPLSFQDSCVAMLNTMNSLSLLLAVLTWASLPRKPMSSTWFLYMVFSFLPGFVGGHLESEWGPLPRQAIPFFGSSVRRFFPAVGK